VVIGDCAIIKDKEIFMRQFTYEQAKKNLDGILSMACDDSETVYITRENGDEAVLVSVRDYGSMNETARQLGVKANREHLLESIRQANAGETRPVKEVFDELGIDCPF
jgi:antitoxin YefM